MPTTDKRPLKVFLCHASQDKPSVRELYSALKIEGWIDPWLDKAKILPGQDWRTVIEKAVEESDVVIVCLSTQSVSKEGFVQREIKYAYDIALEKPEETIFLIPLRLDDCVIPRGLRSFHWVNYFDVEKSDAYSDLLDALKLRHEQKLRLEEADRVRQEKEKQETAAVENTKREKAQRDAAERAAREQAKREAAIEKTEYELNERLARDKVAREQALKEEIEKALYANVGREKAAIDALIKSKHETHEKAKSEKTESEDTGKHTHEKIEAEKIGTAPREKPEVEVIRKPAPQNPKKPKHKPNTAIIVALIGLLGTICAALLGLASPLIESWLSPPPISTEAATATITLPSEPIAPSKTIEPNQTSTEFFTPTATSLPTEITDAKGVAMVLVPAGDFMMGSDNSADEKPVHTVNLEAYYIDKYEVTNALYKVCVDINGCQPPLDSIYYDNLSFSNHPVTFINWYMAKAFCEWRGARLPTEAEWEKAARGTSASTYPWGEIIDCSYANYRGRNNYCIGRSSPVGSYDSGKSFYGIFDMAGNATEWVSSLNESYPYSADDGRENLNSTGDRILRGGSWNNRDILLRNADRGWAAPSLTAFDYGFRCAVNVNP